MPRSVNQPFDEDGMTALPVNCVAASYVKIAQIMNINTSRNPPAVPSMMA